MTRTGYRAAALAVALVFASCRTPKAPPAAPPDDRPACDASSALAAAMALRGDGYLQRALDVIVAGEARCTTPATTLARAEILADLGLVEAAIEAYRIYARAGDAAEATAGAAIAELEKLPPPTRETAGDERATALALYRDGVNLRLQGEHDAAITQLRKSYALLPHPLIIVQIGLAHAAAGREVEARRANARAMAIAELIAGEVPTPRLRRGHVGRVRALAFEPGGRVLASASEDGTVKLWDTLTGREQRSLTGHANFVLSVAFSPDGATLVSGSRDGAIVAWDAATGEPLGTIDLDEAITALAFMPDGAHVIAAAGERLYVWSPPGETARAIDPGVGPIAALAVDTTGARVAVGGTAHDIALVDADSGDRVAVLVGHTNHITALAFSPDGYRLASSAEDGTLRMWEVDRGTQLATVEPRIYARQIAFSADGNRYAHVGAGYEVQVRDTATNEVLGAVEGTDRIAYDGDSDRLATITRSGMAVWNAATFEVAAELERLPGVDAVAFSRDGSRLATGGHDLRISVWSETANEPVAVRPDIGAIENLAFGAKPQIVVGTAREMMAVAQIGEKSTLNRELTGDALVAALAVSDTMVLAAAGPHILTWQLDRASILARAPLEPSDAVRCMALDGTGQVLATGDVNGGIQMWDLVGRTSFNETRLHQGLPINGIAIAGTRPLVASAGDDGTVVVWNVETREAIELEGHLGPATAAAFTSDDTYVVSTGTDHTLRLWNYTERAAIQVIAAHRSDIAGMAVRQRDDIVATASHDGTVRLWDVRRGTLLATLATTRDGRWIAVAADGRVAGGGGDDPDAAMHLVYWQAGDIQLPGFVGWQRWNVPDLVPQLLADSP